MIFENLPGRLKQILREQEPPLDSVDKLEEFQKEEGSWTEIPGVGESYAQKLERLVAAKDAEAPSNDKGENGRPKVFISHQHQQQVDVPIADLVRHFFQQSTGNNVDVFQSSNATSGLKVGEAVPAGLRKRLKEAELVVLVYTRPEYDWGFCLWETGLAVDPEKPNKTKVVVLSCCGEKPAMFRNHQIIDARHRESVRGFVNEALSSKDFLPRYGQALTRYRKDEAGLNEIANSFYDDLAELIPSDEASSSWEFWPWLRLELPWEHAESVEHHMEEGENDAAGEIVWKDCTVECDDRVGEMLKRETFEGLSLGELRSVAERAGDARWVEDLCEGVASAAAGHWPDARWCPVYDKKYDQPRVLLLLRRQKIPSESRFLFSVCFPTELEQGNEAG